MFFSLIYKYFSLNIILLIGLWIIFISKTFVLSFVNVLVNYSVGHNRVKTKMKHKPCFELTTCSQPSGCVLWMLWEYWPYCNASGPYNHILDFIMTWWYNDMEMLSTLLALCEGNILVTGGFPSQRTGKAGLWCFLLCQSRDHFTKDFSITILLLSQLLWSNHYETLLMLWQPNCPWQHSSHGMCKVLKWYDILISLNGQYH